MEQAVRVRVSYYLHAWQAFLMFLAGMFSVLAAFTGYVIKSGGAEELLRGALANLDSEGRVQFNPPQFDWRNGVLEVTDLRRKEFKFGDKAGADSISGLEADKVRVTVDLFPWPPNVRLIEIHGMHKTELTVTQGFLQSGKLREPRAPAFPIKFVDCDLKLNIGNIVPLKLTGCSGELRKGQHDEMRGEFSLRTLNGKPFNIKLDALEDRWLLTGDNIQLNTRDVVESSSNPFSDKLDPVGLLVRSLFSGEMGAEGIVSSLRIVVQPATSSSGFSCDGEVGYQNLDFRLPPAEKEVGQALPWLLDQLLGAEGTESLWPRWMQIDRIKTGENGRVTFHMSNGRLDFACDEGTGSAFTGSRGTQSFPPLESLKGSVETDALGRPARIILRGFLGGQLSFETRIEHGVDKSRTYELSVEPRGGDSKQLVFKQPLWRFKSKVKDYRAVENIPELPYAEFELEADARHFPKPDLLPIGFQNISGHMYAKGRYTRTDLLHFDTINLDDGAGLTYGGNINALSVPGARSNFGPLWRALFAAVGTELPWKLHDLSLTGQADVQFEQADKGVRHWKSTSLKNWRLESGTLEHAGRTTDIGVPGLQFEAVHQQKNEPPYKSEIQFSAFIPDLWAVKWEGIWEDKGGAPSGSFKLREENVPFLLHPQRDALEARFVSPDKRRVNRTTSVTIHDDTIDRDVKP
jgi:hypothetical protein